MSESTSGVCVRCGDFLAPDKRVPPDLVLCARCFEPKAIKPEPLVLSPPAAGFAVGCGVPALAAVLGGVAGLLVALPRDGDLALATALGGLAGTVVLLLSPLRARVNAVQDRVWKRATLAALGFGGDRPAPGAFVLFAERRPILGFVGAPEDVGLLLESDQAVAVLGARGARPVFAIEDVARVSVERLFLGGIWPVCARLERASGGSLWITHKEGPTRAANRAATRALAERLQSRLFASRAERGA